MDHLLTCKGRKMKWFAQKRITAASRSHVWPTQSFSCIRFRTSVSHPLYLVGTANKCSFPALIVSSRPGGVFSCDRVRCLSHVSHMHPHLGTPVPLIELLVGVPFSRIYYTSLLSWQDAEPGGSSMKSSDLSFVVQSNGAALVLGSE